MKSWNRRTTSLRPFMLTISLAALVSLLPQKSQAQLGLNLRYLGPIEAGWVLQNNTDQSGQEVLLNQGYEFGVDYWLYLEGLRIEFLPEITYSHLSIQNIPEADLKSRGLGVHLNTNIYVFDLQGDCGCPTFSKQGSFFSKGFFIQLSPGLLYQNQQINGTDSEVSISSNSLAFSLGAAFGLDIGLSDRFTLTPIGGIRWLPSVPWEGLNELESNGIPWRPLEADPALLLWQAGLRFGFRFR